VHVIGSGSVDIKDIKIEFNAASVGCDEIEAQLRAVPNNDPAVLHPQAAERYRQQVAELHAAIKTGSGASREVVELIRAMIEVHPGRDRTELIVVRTLAGFIHRQHDGVSTPMVAGARVHRGLKCRC
jgi:hypothetical protein